MTHRRWDPLRVGSLKGLCLSVIIIVFEINTVILIGNLFFRIPFR